MAKIKTPKIVEAKEKLSRGETIFTYVVNVFMVICMIGAFYPIVYVFSASVSSGVALDRGLVYLWPVDFTFGAYEYLFQDNSFWVSFGNSLLYMFAGTFYCMVVSVMAGFVLARREFIFNKGFNVFILMTMWLSAGTIPTYLNYNMLGMKDSRLAMILGFGLSAYNILLIRSYFESLPGELIQAARIDGASEAQILRLIYIPLSTPILATVSLFYSLTSWNSWFWYSLLIKTESKQPIQIVLRRLLMYATTNPDDTSSEIVEVIAGVHNATTIKYAIMVFSLIPILLIYPYIQKYFTKGVTLGGVKS